MHYIKCHNIDQVPRPTSNDVPRLIWVSSGELYADLEVSGKPLRIKISDIEVRRALPDTPRESAIYRNNDRFKYYTSEGWQTIATASDLTDTTYKKTLPELFAAVFNDSTGVDKLNTGIARLDDNVAELVSLLTEYHRSLGILTDKVTTLEEGVSLLDDRLTKVEGRVTNLESGEITTNARVGQIEQSLVGLTVRLENI